MRPELECCALAGKAGGLRTAAEIMRKCAERPNPPSFASLAVALDAAADDLDAQSFALLPKRGDATCLIVTSLTVPRALGSNGRTNPATMPSSWLQRPAI
jgi:hypothetical protein